VGEIDPVVVTTSGFWDTLLVYLTFCCPFGFGLMIAGVAPELFTRHKWLIPCLLGVSFAAYALSSLTRT
jgi:hypothetical protein